MVMEISKGRYTLRRKTTMSELGNQTPQEHLLAIKKVGDTSTAITQLQELLVNFPNFIPGWIELGSIYRELGNHPLALKTFSQALEIQPNNRNLKLLLSAEQLLLNQLDQCHQNLQELLENDPEDVLAIIRLGEIERKKNNRKKALKLFQKALELDYQYFWAIFHLGVELLEAGRFNEAKEQFKTGLEFHPGNFNLLMKLGEVEQKRQQLDVALKNFQTVIENHPERIEPYLRKVNILGDLERFVEAKQHLETLEKKYPREPQIFISAGHLERKQGKREKALELFRLAQEKAINPKQKIETAILATEELRDLGNIIEALEQIEAIIEEFPDNLPAKIVKGSILQQQPNLIAAADVYYDILTTDPNHLSSRIELARVYSQSGQVTEAIALFEETDQLFPGNIHVLIQLGSLYQALEDWETAHHWYQKACSNNPYNPHGYIKLARLMFLQGETELAINLLQEVQVKIPNSLPIAITLIDMQTRLGNFETSHGIITEWLNLFPKNRQLLWQLCYLNVGKGDYITALEVLDTITPDNQEWWAETESLRANIYFYQYNYKKAEEHFIKAIELIPIATQERSRLATILMLTGRINEARQQFKIATEELNLKTSPAKSAIPLKSHPAMITNQLRFNPGIMAEIQAIQQEAPDIRIRTLASLIIQEPSYLGSALYFTKELREQGIFAKLQQNLTKNQTDINAIPKIIMQFWDEPEPPQEVQKVCQSWKDLNPDYEYIRFNLDTAFAFLHKHYDGKVLQAFAHCDQPATQADFFRLAFLNKMGGFYADADDRCHRSLNSLIHLNSELIVAQEDIASIGNNFIACVPGESIIRTAFYQVVNTLIDYCNESPWFKTGPGLLTSVVANSLVPYITYTDYQMWPRLLVLNQSQLRQFINQNISLAYKKTNKSWSQKAYQRRISSTKNQAFSTK